MCVPCEHIFLILTWVVHIERAQRNFGDNERHFWNSYGKHVHTGQRWLYANDERKIHELTTPISHT